MAVAVDVAEVGAGVVAEDCGCALERAIAVAHEGVGDVGVADVEAAIGFADVDVGDAVAVEVPCGDESITVDGGVAGARREAATAVAEIGEDLASGADDEIKFAVVVEVCGGEVGAVACGGDEWRKGSAGVRQ